MRIIKIIIFILSGVQITSGQTNNKIDTMVLLKKDWIQWNNEITYINHCYECRSANLTINNDKKWGNIGDKKTELIIGVWKIEKGDLILYDPFWHGLGHICTIKTLTDTSLVFWYRDLREIPRTIKLKPK